MNKNSRHFVDYIKKQSKILKVSVIIRKKNQYTERNFDKVFY